MIYKFFDKKSAGSGVIMHANNEIKQNHRLAEELHKPYKKFKKRTVCSRFKGNIWGCWSSWYAIKKEALKKDLDFFCVLLIFLVNMPGLFL